MNNGILSEANARELRRELDIALARLSASVLERPWGQLVYNLSNPDYYDANRARIVRAVDPEEMVREVVQFYSSHGLTPRAKFDDGAQLASLPAHFEARGFRSEHGSFRIMCWSGEPPAPTEPTAGMTISVATAADLDAIVEIQQAAEGWESSEWLRRKVGMLLSAAGLRYFLATIDGVPAACAMLLQLPEVGLIEDVATAPSHRRRGLASELIRRLQSQASTPLLLEVSDEGAQRIYTRAGFQVRADVREWHCWLEEQ
jgi:GNAT superfamily N-acetyltransferase